ncbi:hypothetical protein [Methylocystis sp. ATCC 49242]|uniref:hypothetical protein n=1 Tax=Methylocystis sp. ATCC 49242 TaxID=622637 RepID=UPI00130E054E|nr:hypothetical protein [Methylocystis sp. ATCC 49242]
MAIGGFFQTHTGVGLRRKRACLGERSKLSRRTLDAMRPNGRREIDVAAEGVLDFVVEATKRFCVGVNPLLFSVSVLPRASGDSDEMHERRVVPLLQPPGVTMVVECDREADPRFLGTEPALECERDAENIVRRLARVIFAPVRGEIVDGGLAGHESPILAFEGELALIALIVKKRGGARAPRAVARELHDGGLRAGGETGLGGNRCSGA